MRAHNARRKLTFLWRIARDGGRRAAPPLGVRQLRAVPSPRSDAIEGVIRSHELVEKPDAEQEEQDDNDNRRDVRAIAIAILRRLWRLLRRCHRDASVRIATGDLSQNNAPRLLAFVFEPTPYSPIAEELLRRHPVVDRETPNIERQRESGDQCDAARGSQQNQEYSFRRKRAAVRSADEPAGAEALNLAAASPMLAALSAESRGRDSKDRFRVDLSLWNAGVVQW